MFIARHNGTVGRDPAQSKKWKRVDTLVGATQIGAGGGGGGFFRCCDVGFRWWRRLPVLRMRRRERERLVGGAT
jgi:hypothetical protein